MITRRMFLGSLLTSLAAGCFPRKTVIPGAARGDLRITFFTDIHTRVHDTVSAALPLAARALNSTSADLLVGGGDFITDGFESSSEVVRPRWELYRTFHTSLTMPVVPVIGNHDLVAARPRDGSRPNPDPRAEFREFFGVPSTCRSFEASGLHIIVLDSISLNNSPLLYQGEIPPEQLAWLRADLEGVSPDTPIVVATHLPLLTGFFQATKGALEAPPPNRVIVNNREVLSLFEEHNLLLVLQGHLHVNELIRWRSTTFITGGAICGRWWKGPWQGTPEGFGQITMRSGRIEWEYKTYRDTGGALS